MLTPQLKYRLKKIIILAFPSGVNSFLDIFVVAINLVFMGHLSDLHTLAMGISLNFLMLFFAMSAIFSVGTNAQISRYFGAKEYQKASSVLCSTAIGAFFVSLPLIVVGIYGGEYFFQWLGVGEDVKKLALQFNIFLACTLPSILLKNVFVSAFAAIGNTIYPLLVRLISMFFSIGLTYFFVFICHLDMFGVGLAYLIASYLDLGLFAILFFYKDSFFCKMPFERAFFLKVLYIGFPAGIERCLTLFSLVLITKIIATFSDLVLTGAQIGTRIEAFSFMPGFGFMLATMVLVGQNLGAGKIKQAELYTRTILIFSSMVMGFSGLLLIIFAREFSLIFTNDPIILQSSVYYLVAVGLSQIPLIWIFVLDGAIRGAGNTKIPLMINAASIWLLRITPMALMVHYGFDISSIFAVICIETYIRAVIFWYVFKKGVWKKVGSEV